MQAKRDCRKRDSGAQRVDQRVGFVGLAAGRFTFEGFLDINKKRREAHLASLAGEPRTMVFYEAPHKLRNTLADMYGVFGDRRVSVAREITKLYEEVDLITLSGAVAKYSKTVPRGEFVLVVEGARDSEEQEYTLQEAVELAQKLKAGGMSASKAAKEAAEVSGYRKSEIYAGLI